MGMTLAQKLIASHLVSGEMIPGQEIALRIDQTLTQDSTGTMAYLQFESMGIDRVRTLRSTAYIDHNMLQVGFENADDHKYIQTVTKKHGIYFSRPGNGICHQVNLERFGVPGQTLLGSDSHTPTGGGIGMLAIGAGGLDVAVAMGGGAYYIPMPNIVNVRLHGKLPRGAAAKDVILEVLRILSVKGGVGRIIEYSGDGVANLSVPERATITNMGAELGATTSVFPSDEVTRAFLKAQGREKDFTPLCADDDAVYEKTIDIDLGALRPMAACPHSPDAVCDVSELAGKKVDQVCIGSCTNSSYLDLMRAARILKGRHVADGVSLVVSPGSRQVLSMIAENGALNDLLCAGARLLECACGPCIGMGQAPGTDAVSLRTFNRNFKGRTYAMPMVTFCYPLVVNVDILQDCGIDPADLKTRSDFLDACKKITAKGSNAFAWHANTSNPSGLDHVFLNSFWTSGGRMRGDDGLFYIADNAEFKATAEYFKEMVDNKYIYPGFTTMAEPDVTALFGSGEVAFCNPSLSMVSIWSNDNPDLNFTVIPNPVADGYTGEVFADYACWGIGISENCKYKEEAMMFIDYMFSADVNARLAEGKGCFPGSTVAEPDYSEQSENFQLAFEIWKTQTPRAEFNASIDASTLRSGILENVVLYVMGDISLDEMAKGAQAVCDEVYK